MDIGVDRVARAVEERLSLNNSGKGALISVGT
jgi:hypothetical protein